MELSKQTQEQIRKEAEEIADDLEDDVDFIPCSKCDGHPACEDFGCAYQLGLGRIVKKDDWT